METGNVLAAEKSATVRCDIANPQGLAFEGSLKASLRAPDGSALASAVAETSGGSVTFTFDNLAGRLVSGNSTIPCFDRCRCRTDDRPWAGPTCRDISASGTAEFTAEGFLLNGRRLKLRGLNRHQAFLVCRLCHGPLRAGAWTPRS